VTFEFELVPRTPPGVFTAEDLDEMRAWWEKYPTAAAADGTLLLFADERTRALDLERLRRRPDRNDYLVPYVSFGPEYVQLSTVGDRVTETWLHDFAEWVQDHWPAELQYFGRPAPASDILSEEPEQSEDDA
jgi:hypothetical protein